MVLATLWTTLLFALAVAANPVVVQQKSIVTLSMSRRTKTAGILHLLLHDQSRAKSLLAKAEALLAGILEIDDVINSQLDNRAVSYVASIGVGNPPTTYDLIVDTGSSNTWIGANKTYVETSTSSQTPNNVNVSYGSGSFSGKEFIDQVTITPDLIIPRQSIGVASNSTGFSGVDGILGVGPVNLTIQTLIPDSNASIPTVTDNLFSAGTIDANTIGISFEPITSPSGQQLNGAISWGGVDSSKFTGLITFTPITTTSPASTFWGIDQSIIYDTTTILSTTAGIVDTGTTLILIATDAFNKYKSATGAVADSDTGLLSITSAQFDSLKSLFFVVKGVSFELTPNAQIWPRALNADIGGVASNIYLIVSDIGNNSGSGLDFINGQTFLERFYSVYDTDNQRVGLATTPFTYATTN